ncbi:Txe/YoeB family addiction module toxin [Protofrankia symbiont of Coriaria ruscifolia]|uniref:Txe/YoeB family addiction module toxin n=1 Tax=Protofrankia symbiont of Coriaria ruscifolia TaxID=1306542 RepID=UPI0010416443|nr:Txe/YoeB family addiction module toxin [Protofrankia symbiont of Coriaria ruscifolia]
MAPPTSCRGLRPPAQTALRHRVVFTSRARDDYTSWADDRKTLRRINRLIEESVHDPATGIGKPEPLSQNLSGYWPRRITDEHRLVYQMRGDDLIIIQVRYRY